jgi:phospholipid transport system substrate-binding protein
MPTRRILLTSMAATAVLAATGPWRGAAAQQALSPEQAARFVEQTGTELVNIVNGPGTLQSKQAALQQVVDRTVNVDDVARFSLGRFWRTATPEQQIQYVDLFHRVLMLNVTSKVADYKGVSFTMGRATPRDGDVAVTTTVNRPGQGASRVDWIISNATGSPKIIDIVAEGTSLRLTQRSDYAAYLQRNNNNIQALIDAMRQQISKPT